MFKRILITLKCFALMTGILFPMAALAQVVSGVVKDEKGEPLYGASVIIKGTTVGAQTDFEGEFEFNARRDPPFTLVITYIGHQTVAFEVTSSNIRQKLSIKMQSAAVEVEAVEVRDMRITEKQKEAPLTIESMGLVAIKQTPAADFYTGLGTLKGVDLTTASLGFVIINTRGFNSTRPVRSLQLVDGADNQAPGLNFSLGNFAGSPEMDIQKVDLIVGASSALYGPNAFNGVINMNTKSPFIHKGLTVFVKGAERRLFETGLRYARAFSNKADDDKFAFKVNFAYIRADDWEATNLAKTPQSLSDETNPGGYDAVNRYGDENLVNQANNFNDKYGRKNFPGLGIFYRTGYEEQFTVDYDMRNVKTGTSLHYRITDDIEWIATYNFGSGTTVYQGENRYSLNGLKFHQTRLEVMKPDKFYVRAYTTMENAGDTYDAVFTAFKLQQDAKSDYAWSADYSNYWQQHIRRRVIRLPGFPNPNLTWTDAEYEQADMVLRQYHDSLVVWHQAARKYADGKTVLGKARYEPGTAAFDSIFNKITSSTSFTEGGTKFYDKSKLVHLQGEYKFTPKFADIYAGASYRLYLPNSDGTIFSDTSGRRITNWEYGFYGSIEKKAWLNRLIFTFAMRFDKNQNFSAEWFAGILDARLKFKGPLVSPAASIVYRQNDQTLRLSFSSALRNPTLQDQYLYYNVGRAILIGNINGVDSLVTPESITDYITQNFNDDALAFFSVPPVRPEKVKSIEAGYRGILLKNIYVDGSFYYSWYKDFLGYKIGVTPPDSVNPIESRFQAYRVSANSSDRVVTYGCSAGVTYYFHRNYSVSGNYSWNVLDRKGSEDPIIPAYNTPEHKFNVAISGKDIAIRLGKLKIADLGFSFNYKWIQGFEFEGSPQFTGPIETYGLLDGQINYTNKRIYTTFKLGASNIINNLIYQTYGGPFVGRMVYFSVLVDISDI